MYFCFVYIVPTVFDNYTANVEFEGKKLILGLWDTAGQEDYDYLRPLSYPGTDIFILAFSVVDPVSFENIRSKWVPEIRKYEPYTPFLIIGTKTDLRGDASTLHDLDSLNQTAITRLQGDELCRELKGHKYMECSALTQAGLKEIFDECIRCFLQRQEEASKPKRRCSIL